MAALAHATLLWLAANPLVTTWLVGAMLALATRARTGLEWEFRKLNSPRGTAALQCLRAVTIDLDKLKTWLPVLFTGTLPPSPPASGTIHIEAPAAPPVDRGAITLPPDAKARVRRAVLAPASATVGVLALAMLDCSGTLRQQVTHVSNVAVAGVDAATERLLTTYCERSMLAIGHTGAYVSDSTAPAGFRCVAGGPGVGTPATAAQDAALAALRAQWATVLDRAEAVVQTQRALARLLAAGSAATDGDVLAATGAVAAAYADLRAAASAADVPVPPALSLGGR